MGALIEAFRDWMDDRTEWKCKVKSTSKEGVKYLVRKMKEGYWRCNCPATVECKHIKLAKKYYEQRVTTKK